ncbi:MAG: sel1 repeat family protein [Gammaproteobacteria bacterium]|nr:sel1 repeat family protein [Gammaproteobacteria bacterium]
MYFLSNILDRNEIIELEKMQRRLMALTTRNLFPCLVLLFSAVFQPVIAEDALPDSSKEEGDAPSKFETALSWVDQGEYSKAVEVFKKLAQQGNAEAQYNLAMLYRNGTGVDRDNKQSAMWFRRAAEQDVPDAQYMLGNSYDNGEGVPKSTKWAFIWYRKAAELGHALAQINLGVMYANGLGVDQDIEKAYLWFHAAAAQGYPVALENRKIVEDALTPEQLEAVKSLASEYYNTYVVPFLRESYRHSNSRGSPPLSE